MSNIEKLKKEIRELDNKRDKLIKQLKEEVESRCSHTDKNGKLTIEYDNTYEMRSSDMHCTQCGKNGSRKEFQNNIS